jgi:hypothetical protein
MTSKDVVMSEIQAAWLTDKDGKKYAVETDTRLLVDGEEKAYGTYWVNLTKGSGAVLYFGEDGKLDIIYCLALKGQYKGAEERGPADGAGCPDRRRGRLHSCQERQGRDGCGRENL